MNPIERSVVNLLRSDGIFYASLLMQMKRVQRYDLSTCGVTVQNGRIVLYWNPDFFDKLKAPQAQAVLEHECLHLCFLHCLRGADKHHDIWNLATDIAINQKITNLPPEALLPKSFPQLNLPSGEMAEIYYEILDKKLPKYIVSKNADGSMTIEGPDGKKITVNTLDNHGEWSKEEGKDGKGKELGELEKEVIRQAVKEAYEEAQAQGKVPGGLTEAIQDLLKQPTIPWHVLLKRFIGNSVRGNHKYTWKRLNRRIDSEDLKGRMRTRKLKLVAALDTSGSIGDDDFQKFLGELRGIQHAYKSEFTMIECDADIQKVYSLPAYGAMNVAFKGRGGTDFRPVFKYIEEKALAPDVLVFMTDGYGAFPEKAPRYPTVWVLTPDSTDAASLPFGHKIKIEGEKRRRR